MICDLNQKRPQKNGRYIRFLALKTAANFILDSGPPRRNNWQIPFTQCRIIQYIQTVNLRLQYGSERLLSQVVMGGRQAVDVLAACTSQLMEPQEGTC
jgi:hypothetical protein